MNAYQRRRRIVLWCSSFPVLLVFTILILVLIMANQVAPLNPQELGNANLGQQVRYSPKLVTQKAESILAASQ
jgi:hypothetical protein